ncbi:hypothetical protein SH412_000201 [Planctellipticum variicoloris]|nr:hypothetical protein SH412_000201 [Planctomycetaceae bacterium SH412]
MPRGDKSKYTDKQKRTAKHIEESDKERGVGDEVADAARLGHRERHRWRRQASRWQRTRKVAQEETDQRQTPFRRLCAACPEI